MNVGESLTCQSRQGHQLTAQNTQESAVYLRNFCVKHQNKYSYRG